MPKEDIINVYSLCVRRYDDNYVGVADIDHDLNEIQNTLKEVFKFWCNEWAADDEIFIRKEQQNVVKYLLSNCDNVSVESAQKLAEEHGFTLQEINWNHW